MATAPQPKPHKYIVFTKFKKMNTKVDRPALEENELAWIENLIPIGSNKLQTVPAPLSPQIATITGKTLSRTFGATIGNNDYVIAFTTDGGGYAINVNTGSQVQFASTGFFSHTPGPDITVYASERILIMDPTANYATWDGTLFVGSGGVSPNIQVTNGGTYSSTPTVTITGGSGTGATAHALMGGSGSNQFVGEVVLDTAGTGYLPGDTLTVVFSSGAATATARVWPQVGGTSIGIFSGRVWWCSAPPQPNPQVNVRQLNFTGTNGYDDLNPANAAGATTITDADLAHNITVLRGLNNYLYLFGDNSIRQIGSITVQSSITLFTPFTISSDIGTTFQLTVISYNRFIVFANKNGVYGLYGSSVQKISDDLDGIFENLQFASNRFASALNDFHVAPGGGGSIHCYMLFAIYNDPIAGTRPIFMVFDGKQWFIVSQSSITAVQTVLCSLPNATTNQWEPYAGTLVGSDSQIIHLLQDSTTAVAVRLQTSLSPHGDPINAKQVFHTGVAMTLPVSPGSINVSVDTENGSISYPFQGVQGFQLLDFDTDGYGKFIGATITGNMVNSWINSVCIEYGDADPWGRLP